MSTTNNIPEQLIKIEHELRVVVKEVKETNSILKRACTDHTDYTYIITYSIGMLCLAASIIVIGNKI